MIKRAITLRCSFKEKKDTLRKQKMMPLWKNIPGSETSKIQFQFVA